MSQKAWWESLLKTILLWFPNKAPLRLYACDAFSKRNPEYTTRLELGLKAETTYQAVVGRVLVRMRNELADIDQKKLADSVGVNQSTWSRIERGESSLSVEQLFLAAEAMRVEPSVVLWEVQEALKDLKSQDVVISRSSSTKVGQGAALIGAASLGALVGAAFAKNSKDEPE